MTSYAPGTPLSVIKKMDKKFYGTPLPKGKPQAQPTKPAKPMAQKPNTPMPRPQIDEGFGNGPRRPMPSGKPIIQNPKPMPRPVKDIGTGNGAGRPKMNPMMKAGGKVADGIAKKGKTKGRYI